MATIYRDTRFGHVVGPGGCYHPFAHAAPPNGRQIGESAAFEHAEFGWTEILLTGPSPGYRYQPVMVYDRARQRTVLYGGSGSESDTWEWDGRRWQRVA